MFELGSASENEQTLGIAERQDPLTFNLVSTKLKRQMQAVWQDLVEGDNFVYQLIEKPGVRGGGSGEFSGDIEPSWCEFEKSGASCLVGGAGVVVDVSAELPGEYVEVKIVEVFEGVIDGVKGASCTSLGLNGRGPDIAQFNFGSKGDDTGLEVGSDSLEVATGDPFVEDGIGGPDGILDVIDEVMFGVWYGVQTLLCDDVDDRAAGVYHLQGGEEADGATKIPFRDTHTSQVKSISGVNLVFQLVQQDLLQYENQIVFNEGSGLIVLEEVCDGRPGPVELMFEVIVADGVTVGVAVSERIAYSLSSSDPTYIAPSSPMAGAEATLPPVL